MKEIEAAVRWWVDQLGKQDVKHDTPIYRVREQFGLNKGDVYSPEEKELIYRTGVTAAEYYLDELVERTGSQIQNAREHYLYLVGINFFSCSYGYPTVMIAAISIHPSIQRKDHGALFPLHVTMQLERGSVRVQRGKDEPFETILSGAITII